MNSDEDEDGNFATKCQRKKAMKEKRQLLKAGTLMEDKTKLEDGMGSSGDGEMEVCKKKKKKKTKRLELSPPVDAGSASEGPSREPGVVGDEQCDDQASKKKKKRKKKKKVEEEEEIVERECDTEKDVGAFVSGYEIVGGYDPQATISAPATDSLLTSFTCIKAGVKDQPLSLEMELRDVRLDLRRVVSEISGVEKSIFAVEKQLMACSNMTFKGQLMTEKELMLMKDKDYLRKKKQKLMEMELTLREMELILMDNLKAAEALGPARPPPLYAIDMTCSVSPVDIVPPSITSPPFLTTAWLSEEVELIAKKYRQSEIPTDGVDTYRVPPTALVRCSRGGKTRALHEIGQALKSRFPDAAVIFVSFNAGSTIEVWEQKDPVGALCRRIAHAARPRTSDARHDNFDSFYSTVYVSPADIITWLGDSPCILLIDELNQIEELNDSRSRIGGDFASFLRDHFLMYANRYFIFSSHVISIVSKLQVLMRSPRDVSVRHLPLIPNLSSAVDSFQCPSLTVGEAFFFGLIPALIFENSFTTTTGRDKKMGAAVAQKMAVDACMETVSEDSINNILASYFSGRHQLLPQELLCLMDSTYETVRWIPFHLSYVLASLAPKSDARVLLDSMSQLLCGMSTVCEVSGKAWEQQFVFALLARIKLGLFHSPLLPVSAHELLKGYTISFNSLYSWSCSGLALADCTTMQQLMNRTTKPDTYPHIAVYYPPHEKFEDVDVLVVVHYSRKKKVKFHYQLKSSVLRVPAVSDMNETVNAADKWFLIGGWTQTTCEQKGVWVLPSTDVMEAFLGESGRLYTPQNWNYVKLG